MNVGLYRVVAFGHQLGIGVSGSYQITISAIAKSNGPWAPYCVPNELICSEIGRFLRLPIPPFGIVSAPNAPEPYWFASLDFNLTGNALPSIDPAECVERLPDLSAGLLLFDTLVANSDRHRGNVSVDLSIQPPRMSIFDHSHALFGFEQGKGVEHLTAVRDQLAVAGGPFAQENRHCLVDVIKTDDHFGKWWEWIKALPDFFIEEVCRAAVGLGIDASEADAAIDFLRYRRDNLHDIITRNKAEFRAIHQWSLFS